MATFEEFVQTELPLRPFTFTDPPQETILVRRGPGPRQMEAVSINEGEFLTKIGGVIQSGPASGGGSTLNTEVFTQTTASTTWNITHTNNSADFVLQVFDDNGDLLIPDSITAVDASNITVAFSNNITGKAVVIFAN